MITKCTVEVVSNKALEVEPEYVDVVGHITLKSLEKSDKKRKDRSREHRGGQQQREAPKGNMMIQKRTPNDPSKNVAPRKEGPQKPQHKRRPPGNNPQKRD